MSILWTSTFVAAAAATIGVSILADAPVRRSTAGENDVLAERRHAVPTENGAGADTIERTGTITGWSISADGNVYVRLEGRDDRERDFAIWFVTPASQSATTEFENLVLDAVLAITDRSKAPIEVAIRSNVGGNEVSGKTRERAMPLSGLTVTTD